MHDIDSVKKRIITSMIAILLLIFALFGITYAYFTAKVKGNTNEKSADVSAGKLELTYSDGNGFIKVENIQPGEVIKSKTFTVKNTGTGEIDSYEVILENVVNELKYYNDLTYELECVSDIGTCNGSNDTFPIYDNPIVTNSIKVGETHTYTLKLTYNETYLDQSDDMAKTIVAKVNIRDSEFNYTKLNIYGNTEGLGTLVNDENDRFNGKYKIDIKSVGKNLFDVNGNLEDIRSGMTTVSDGNIIVKPAQYAPASSIFDYISVIPSETINISYNILQGGYRTAFRIYDKDKNHINDSSISISNFTYNVYYKGYYTNKTNASFTVPNDAYYIRILMISMNPTNNIDSIYSNYQVEKGTTATTYEPYEEETYSIYVDEPLRCIDTTCDYVDLVNKKVIRKIKNDNGTLSILDTPTEEKIQSVDSDVLTNRNITVDGATNVEQELDR